MDVPRKELYKIIVLGDAGVGKTAILNRYVNDRFTQNYRTTVGADFMSKELEIDNRAITLQIWDTAGQERFQSLGGAFYRGSDCCILTYDVTSVDSLQNLDTWRNSFISSANPKEPETFPFVVIANKIDAEAERKVSRQEGEEWAKTNNYMFFEVSAKDGTNIVEAFLEVAKLVISKDEQEEIYVVNTVKIKNSEAKKAKGDCPC
jgi:Ras-related protein Rab-7A